MASKQENLDLILRKIISHPRTWNELMDSLDVSEPTLSRYLSDLREQDLISKEFNSEDEIIYTPNPSRLVKEEKIPVDFVERSRETNRLLDGLESKGLFEDGITESAILEFLKENADSDRIAIPKEALKKKEKLDLDAWKHFNNLLSSLVSMDIDKEVESKIKIRGSIEDFKVDIDEIKEDVWKEN